MSFLPNDRGCLCDMDQDMHTGACNRAHYKMALHHYLCDVHRRGKYGVVKPKNPDLKNDYQSTHCPCPHCGFVYEMPYAKYQAGNTVCDACYQAVEQPKKCAERHRRKNANREQLHQNIHGKEILAARPTPG